MGLPPSHALLSGATHIHAAGPPSFLILWDRARGRGEVTGIAAMSSIPAYLNTTKPNIKALRGVTDKDRIALNAVKVSIPSIIMQMSARKEFGPAETFRYDKYTVSTTHPDGVAALLSGISEINMHFTSVSFHPREIKDPRVRTIMSSDDGRRNHLHDAFMHEKVQRQQPDHLQGAAARAEGCRCLVQQG